MFTELDIHLPPAKALREDTHRKAAARKLGISPYRIGGMRLLKWDVLLRIFARLTARG